MRVLYPGHRYELAHLKGEGRTILQFSQEAPFHESIPGPSCQEVVRALIDRVQTLDHELPWDGNQGVIIPALRMALAGFEARALLRKVEKGLAVERLPVGADGHIWPVLPAPPD